MLTALVAPPGLHHSDNRLVQDNLTLSNPKSSAAPIAETKINTYLK